MISLETPTSDSPLTIICTLATILLSDKLQTCKSCTFKTPGTDAIDERRRSRGTDEGTPWRRMNEADLTRGRAEEKMMTVMTREMAGSVYIFQE